MDSREKISAFVQWALEQQVPAELEGIANFLRPIIPALTALVLEDEPAVIDEWLLKAAAMATRLRSDGSDMTALYVRTAPADKHDGDNGDVWALVEL